MKTRERVIAPQAINAVSEALARHSFGKKIMLVCDDATWVAIGMKLHHLLMDAYDVTPHSIGRNPRASMENAGELVAASLEADGFIAVGAGTVNDVTKYAAARLHKPYLCVATAASMNGYLSATASLEEDHLKRSYPAQPPLTLIADTDVIAAAPKRMNRAGLGDTLCRSTVEADMLLSHHLFGTSYPKALFDMMRSHEPGLLLNASKLRESNPSFLVQLMEALCAAGDAMAEHGNSEVASQGEHMIAHTAEVMYSSELRSITHGELIAVTSVTMDNLQYKTLLGKPLLKHLPREDAQFIRLFGKKNAEQLITRYNKKMLTPEMATQVNARLETEWPAIKESIAAIMLPQMTIERALVQANVGHQPRDIGISDVRYQAAVTYAHMTRERFTFLDLAAMSNRRL